MNEEETLITFNREVQSAKSSIYRVTKVKEFFENSQANFERRIKKLEELSAEQTRVASFITSDDVITGGVAVTIGIRGPGPNPVVSIRDKARAEAFLREANQDLMQNIAKELDIVRRNVERLSEVEALIDQWREEDSKVG